jgi:hypothetical protein
MSALHFDKIPTLLKKRQDAATMAQQHEHEDGKNEFGSHGDPGDGETHVKSA